VIYGTPKLSTLCNVCAKITYFVRLLVFLVGSSSIYNIYPFEPGLTFNYRPASLRCELETADDFRLQYITWFKISRDDDARREFVYHYDQCTGDDHAYGGLVGRATLTVTSQQSANVVSRHFYSLISFYARYYCTCHNIGYPTIQCSAETNIVKQADRGRGKCGTGKCRTGKCETNDVKFEGP